MRATLTSMIALVVAFGAIGAVQADDLKSKVKVEKSYVGLHPGLDPGLYVCAGGHLHVKGVVQNMADVTLSSVTLEGRAYDAQGKLLGTASPAKKSPRLAPLKPGEKREFDLEFLTVTGPRIEQAKRQDIVVTDVTAQR